MSSSHLVSFVVPCFNYGRFLPDCLNSIFGQQGHFNFEIIAIDDCSTDDTWKILEGFADPRLRLVRHEVNRGHVFTVNEGLTASRGQFVARIDPDDRYRPDFLATLLPRFHAPRVGLVYGDAAVINDRGEITVDRCDRVHGGRDFCGDELLGLLQLNYICAPTAIARRAAWHVALPIWDGLAFNDWYFNVMIAREYDFCYVDQVVADYRVHAANHHSQIVVNKTEEPSILRVLEFVFSHPEKTPEREAVKQHHRGRAYAAQYLTLAEKYFGAGLNADARRCYREVWKHRPAHMLKAGPIRRHLATWLGRNRYEWSKALWHSLFGRSEPAKFPRSDEAIAPLGHRANVE